MEYVIFFGAFALTVFFLIRWYMYVLSSKSFSKSGGIKVTLALLPVFCCALIVFTLLRYASFDVVDSAFYIIFYTLIGLSWFYVGLVLISLLFDFSWIDDVLNLRNKAAFFAVVGCVLAVVLIYCGSNIGDGPGWWCVYFAGGIGLVIGALILLLLNITTNMSERITVERDLAFGIRLFAFLLAIGILLGRASGGDWVSFGQTILDFKDAWPVLPLTLIFILIERGFMAGQKNSNSTEGFVFSSVLLGMVFVASAILSIIYLLPPLAVNPYYDQMRLLLPIFQTGAIYG